MNSLGWTDYNGNKPLNNPAYQAIRTIANEVLYSIAISASGLKTVSYTHLTLPTKRIVYISVVAVLIKKKKENRRESETLRR